MLTQPNKIMDFGFFTFLQQLSHKVDEMLELIKKVVNYLLSKEGEYLMKIADLEEKLAVALGNDATDAATIAAKEQEAAAARQAAEDAAASLATAQGALAVDAQEDSDVAAFLQPLVNRIELETSTPEPEPEPTPEPEA